MDREKQQKAPFVEALEGYCQQHMKAYHTPGHKLGQGISAYQANLFGDALRRDLGVMYALDDLFQPEGPLKEAMDLAADLYGAGRTFFSINGTTACIEAMVLAVCRDGDEIIMESKEAPRHAVKGDRIYLNTSSGGGWGEPMKRAPQKVYDDVLDEIISKETAEAVYGVIINETGIDFEKTEKRRNLS